MIMRHLLALTALLAACDSSSPPLVDGLPDAGADAGVPRARVDVFALDDTDAAGPGAGLSVQFTDAAGRVVATALTDAAGHASALVPDAVTATIGWPTRGHVESITGVRGGDQLHVGGLPEIPGHVIATVTLVVPAVPAGQHVTVIGPCGADSDPPVADGHGALAATVELRPGCAPYTALAYASDAAQHPIAYIAAPVLTPSEGTLSLATSPWLPMPELHTRIALASPGASVFDVVRSAGPARFEIVRDLTHTDAFDGTVTAPMIGARAEEEVQLWVANALVFVAQAIPADLAEQALDVEPLRIPAILKPTYAAGAVAWTLSGPGHADATTVHVQYGAQGITWDILTTPDATSLTLPPLPATMPAIASTDRVTVEVTSAETDLVDDYAAARNLPAGGFRALHDHHAWARFVRASSGLID
jgi:hypothetical protein